MKLIKNQKFQKRNFNKYLKILTFYSKKSILDKVVKTQNLILSQQNTFINKIVKKVTPVFKKCVFYYFNRNVPIHYKTVKKMLQKMKMLKLINIY